MSFCPRCGVEYTDTAESCFDCGISLVPKDLPAESAPECFYCNTLNVSDAVFCWRCGAALRDIDFERLTRSSPGETVRCPNCGSISPLGCEFCADCGYLFSGKRSCVNHPDTMTPYVCLVCQRCLCKRCGSKIKGKFICHDDENYHFVGNWVVLSSDTHQETLEPARISLDKNDICAVIKDYVDSVYRQLPGQYALLVPIVQLKEAERLLIDEGFLFENVCTNCRHEFNGNPNRCPRCGEEFVS